MNNKLRTILIISCLSLISIAGYAGQTVTGAGATFPYPLYARWAEIYYEKTGVQINYQPIGSGGGIQQIKAGTVDFGATDKPLDQYELTTQHLIQFPTVLGAVVPIINLPSIKSGSIKLTGEVLADIYLGNIKNWSDPALKKINPDINLPDQPIHVVHRSDGSGTTYLFTNYLSKVSSSWQKSVGNDAAVHWPVGLGGKGNQGVALYVKQMPGAIGYVEYNYAMTNNLSITQLENKAHVYISPSVDSVRSAANYADWKRSMVILTDEPGANSWPISGATFILISSKVTSENKEKIKATLAFFNWAYQHGKAEATSLQYVMLPESLLTQIKLNWTNQLKDNHGQPLWNQP